MKWLALFVALAGCATQRIAEVPPTPQTLCLNANLQWTAQRWTDEAHLRWPDRKVVLVHGGDFFGVWSIWPDACPLPLPAEATMRLLRMFAPQTKLVLVSCNAHHREIHVLGVAYPRWVIANPPDHFARPFIDDNEACTRSILDFSESK